MQLYDMHSHILPGIDDGAPSVEKSLVILNELKRNGTKVFKAENDKEYYRQQMDNARTTSNRLRTENQEPRPP